MRPAFFSAIALIAGSAVAAPPGSPMTEFGPRQVAVSAFFDHNGLTFYEDPATSILNTAGLAVEYAPWRYLQVGAFGGASELDIAVPDRRMNDPNAHSFDGDYSFTGGATAKAATPRLFQDALRLVGYGSGAWFQVEDAAGNIRRGMYYQGGATLQYAIGRSFNLALGGEYHAVDGEQENTRKEVQPFGLNAATDFDALRGVVGVEYTFPQKNRPFISLSFRPTGSLDWDDRLGLKNGSIAVSFGVIADIGGATPGNPGGGDLNVIEE